MKIRDIEADHIYLACGSTDMRKSIDGLAAIVKQNFNLSPYDKNLFIFCGKRNDRIKGLLWDETGFLLLYKRLESGRFRWPKNQKEALEISSQQLKWLLEGLEVFQKKAIKKVDPGIFI